MSDVATHLPNLDENGQVYYTNRYITDCDTTKGKPKPICRFNTNWILNSYNAAAVSLQVAGSHSDRDGEIDSMCYMSLQ